MKPFYSQLSVWISLAALLPTTGTTEAAIMQFSDDFSTFDTSKWTQYSDGGTTNQNMASDNVNVNNTITGAVYVDGANNWEPASRITHHMATNTNDFRVQFDIKKIGLSGSGQGAFRVGWCVENDYAAIQSHSDYSTITNWALGSHVGIDFHSNQGVRLTHSEQGVSTQNSDFNPAMNDIALDHWYTAILERVGHAIRMEFWDGTPGMGTLLGQDDIQASVLTDYQYFHLSTQDSMNNNAHTNWEVDNVNLTVLPEPGSLSLLTLGGLAMMRRKKQKDETKGSGVL